MRALAYHPWFLILLFLSLFLLIPKLKSVRTIFQYLQLLELKWWKLKVLGEQTQRYLIKASGGVPGGRWTRLCGHFSCRGPPAVENRRKKRADWDVWQPAARYSTSPTLIETSLITIYQQESTAPTPSRLGGAAEGGGGLRRHNYGGCWGGAVRQ